MDDVPLRLFELLVFSAVIVLIVIANVYYWTERRSMRVAVGTAVARCPPHGSFLLPTSIMGVSPSSSLPLDPLRVSIPSRE